MANRVELNEDVLEDVAGGNIRFNHNTGKIQNSTTGAIYTVSSSVNSRDVSEWVYQNYGAYGGDNGIIEALLAKGWIS